MRRVVVGAFLGGLLGTASLLSTSDSALAQRWTGLYMGVQGGVMWADWKADLSNSSGAIHYADPFPVPAQSLNTGTGWSFGLQTGYN